MKEELLHLLDSPGTLRCHDQLLIFIASLRVLHRSDPVGSAAEAEDLGRCAAESGRYERGNRSSTVFLGAGTRLFKKKWESIPGWR